MCCFDYLNTSMTFCAMNESKPDVGSSQNINGGSVRTSDANDSRFISPPEMPLIVSLPISVSRHLVKPN